MVVHRLELLFDIRLPGLEAEAVRGQPEQSDGIDVADELDRILGTVGQVVEIDVERMHLPGGPGVAGSEPLFVPARALEPPVNR